MAEQVTRGGWAKEFLNFLNAPTSKRNMRAIVAWVSAEGTTAKFNPLATTMRWAGATDFNSVGVKNYLSLEDGIGATTKTIKEGGHGYEPIVHHLREGHRPRRTLAAVEESAWGTGGLALLVLKSMRDYDNYDAYAKKVIGQ